MDWWTLILTGGVGVAAITVICYLLVKAIKATELDNKWLPVLCGLMGALWVWRRYAPAYRTSQPRTS